MFEQEIKHYEQVRCEYEERIVKKMAPADYMDWHEVLFSTHSCAIEGNSFTVDDTRILKEQGLAMVPVGHSLLECTEMADHFRAFRYVTTHLNAAFDETLLCETNRLVTENTLSYRAPGAVPGTGTPYSSSMSRTVLPTSMPSARYEAMAPTNISSPSSSMPPQSAWRVNWRKNTTIPTSASSSSDSSLFTTRDNKNTEQSITPFTTSEVKIVQHRQHDYYFYFL